MEGGRERGREREEEREGERDGEREREVIAFPGSLCVLTSSAVNTLSCTLHPAAASTFLSSFST